MFLGSVAVLCLLTLFYFNDWFILFQTVITFSVL